MMDYFDINLRAFGEHDQGQIDLDYGYTKSIDEYILNDPTVLFTRYEFCYLHDIYCLYIGIESYYQRYIENIPITIQEILDSKFYKRLLWWMNEFEPENLAVKPVGILNK
jgi:hypothetical protein